MPEKREKKRKDVSWKEKMRKAMLAPPLRKLTSNGTFEVTEDTPPDMLEGCMDLNVVLPSGKEVRVTIERKTPMMDLLVQVTTANKINPGGHMIHLFTDRGKDFIHYKPNTPIGALETSTIHIVPKNSILDPAVKKPEKVNGQPFEKTIRLQASSYAAYYHAITRDGSAGSQKWSKATSLSYLSSTLDMKFSVNLPRNQLTFLRVNPRTALAEVLRHVCEEKSLDPRKYELRHPRNLNERLQLSRSISEYQISEVSVVVANKGNHHGSILSSADILAMHRSSDDPIGPNQKGFNYRKSKSSMGDSSASSDSLGDRSSPGLSPTRSDESLTRSVSPPSTSAPIFPKPPPRVRKRPAPKPPATNGQSTTLSRGASDASSGFSEKHVNGKHDEGEATEGKPKTSTPTRDGKVTSFSSLTNLTTINSTSNLSIASTTGKKRRAPAPPTQAIKEESGDAMEAMNGDGHEAPIAQKSTVRRQSSSSSANGMESISIERETKLEKLPDPVQIETVEKVKMLTVETEVEAGNGNVSVSPSLSSDHSSTVSGVSSPTHSEDLPNGQRFRHPIPKPRKQTVENLLSRGGGSGSSSVKKVDSRPNAKISVQPPAQVPQRILSQASVDSADSIALSQISVDSESNFPSFHHDRDGLGVANEKEAEQEDKKRKSGFRGTLSKLGHRLKKPKTDSKKHEEPAPHVPHLPSLGEDDLELDMRLFESRKSITVPERNQKRVAPKVPPTMSKDADSEKPAQVKREEFRASRQAPSMQSSSGKANVSSEFKVLKDIKSSPILEIKNRDREVPKPARIHREVSSSSSLKEDMIEPRENLGHWPNVDSLNHLSDLDEEDKGLRLRSVTSKASADLDSDHEVQERKASLSSEGSTLSESFGQAVAIAEKYHSEEENQPLTSQEMEVEELPLVKGKDQRDEVSSMMGDTIEKSKEERRVDEERLKQVESEIVDFPVPDSIEPPDGFKGTPQGSMELLDKIPEPPSAFKDDEETSVDSFQVSTRDAETGMEPESYGESDFGDSRKSSSDSSSLQSPPPLPMSSPPKKKPETEASRKQDAFAQTGPSINFSIDTYGRRSSSEERKLMKSESFSSSSNQSTPRLGVSKAESFTAKSFSRGPGLSKGQAGISESSEDEQPSQMNGPFKMPLPVTGGISVYNTKPWIVRKTSASANRPASNKVKTSRGSLSEFRATSMQNLSTSSASEDDSARVHPQNGSKESDHIDSSLRRATSDLHVSTGTDGDEHDEMEKEYIKLQQQSYHWQNQLIHNQSILENFAPQGSTSLQSFTMIKDLMPRINNSTMNAEDQEANLEPKEKNKEVKAQTLPRQGTEHAPEVTLREKSATIARMEPSKRYSYQGPPTINMSTWSERPRDRPIRTQDMWGSTIIDPPLYSRGGRVIDTPQMSVKDRMAEYHSKRQEILRSFEAPLEPVVSTASTKSEPVVSIASTKPEPVVLRTSTKPERVISDSPRSETVTIPSRPKSAMDWWQSREKAAQSNPVPKVKHAIPYGRNDGTVAEESISEQEEEVIRSQILNLARRPSGDREREALQITKVNITKEDKGNSPSRLPVRKTADTSSQNGHKFTSVVTVSNGVSKPSSLPIPVANKEVPPPPPMGGAAIFMQKRVTAGGRRIVPPKNQPKLDPREELMIAIRNFGGHESLKKTG
ncbi:unnamed protein product [Darwinula stevensoni]|uniref:WH2 domain-containing protein n=1 Tax=Darwinula stevensoni TaxID=69355 RepID=A0A7R8XD22_9CRUS|nr:unnamed protein product [Darwinula stevensoni]CAG0894271.1 unnamed protein product [Darwinula stevensoni]